MDFISNKDAQVKEMLLALGITSIDALFSSIPESMKLSSPSEDDGLSEYDGMRLMESIGSKNTYSQFQNYLGAGAYEHHVPVLVSAICGKSEFLTAYTPYQAEASQGMLQAIFEFQSAICALTGMDAANASVYDGASACAEAILMALRHHKERKKIILAESIHPHYKSVVEQYASSHGIEIETIPFLSDYTLDYSRAKELLDENTAALLLQYPNFFGVLDDISALTVRAKHYGALTILSANPLAYGLFASAGELGADIAVGDTQPFGLPLQFGGPYVGYMACKQEFLRQLPGRIVGETVDTQGKRGFVLTLQAREQHIRREKATSNICTNQALAALASLVAILWYGKEGVKRLALTNYQRTAYLKERLAKIPGLSVAGSSPGFNEFVLKFEKPLEDMFKIFRTHRIEPGLDLSRYFPRLNQHILVAVTETKSKEQLDNFCWVAEQACK